MSFSSRGSSQCISDSHGTCSMPQVFPHLPCEKAPFSELNHLHGFHSPLVQPLFSTIHMVTFLQHPHPFVFFPVDFLLNFLATLSAKVKLPLLLFPTLTKRSSSTIQCGAMALIKPLFAFFIHDSFSSFSCLIAKKKLLNNPPVFNCHFWPFFFSPSLMKF